MLRSETGAGLGRVERELFLLFILEVGFKKIVCGFHFNFLKRLRGRDGEENERKEVSFPPGNFP